MQVQPLIAVTNVETSSRWYQKLLGAISGHGGAEYEQLLDEHGKLVLQLHHWDAHDHPHLGKPSIRPYGNGVLLWFHFDNFTAALKRAQALDAEVLQGPLFNPNAGHHELWLRDPDGYVVVLAGQDQL
ncbi:VOC family protein [Andreprevotia chitinilytica]|uniref:VOC family protein n=1 Tax=Andreprevotia chitinilytica TaxID=396808 RepID=UPI00054DFC6C|nr:VOC family protein [Andreprevotia chitinilytica]